jgi:hypothetical protein
MQLQLHVGVGLVLKLLLQASGLRKEGGVLLIRCSGRCQCGMGCSRMLLLRVATVAAAEAAAPRPCCALIELSASMRPRLNGLSQFLAAEAKEEGRHGADSMRVLSCRYGACTVNPSPTAAAPVPVRQQRSKATTRTETTSSPACPSSVELVSAPLLFLLTSEGELLCPVACRPANRNGAAACERQSEEEQAEGRQESVRLVLPKRSWVVES